MQNPSTTKECEICKRKQSQAYTFYAGKKLAEEATRYESYIISKITYDVKPDMVNLCARCVLKYQIRRLVYPLFITIFFFGMIFLSLTVRAQEDSWVPNLFGLLMGIVFGLGGIYLIVIALDKNEMGAEKAIKNHKKEWKNYEYDTFWTPKQYKKLPHPW
jgi:hypothetical protein